ncbi:MAG: homoserine/homoserine lactone efflux protein [Pseudomonadota bacterium]
MTFLPDFPTLVAFTLATWLLAATPGPDMTLSISRALSDGKTGGLMVILGTNAGIIVHSFLVAFGVSALIVASPTAFWVLKTGGAAYLLWLAINALRHGSSFSAVRAEGPRRTAWSNFLTGLGVNLLNPKVIIFFMTFLPQFVDPSDPHVTSRLLFLGFWFLLASLPVVVPVVLAAERLSVWLKDNPRILRSIDIAFAGVFSIFAVKILFAQAK